MTERMKKMTLKRLRTLAEAYGANPARWPDVEQGAAKDFLAKSHDAQKLVKQAGLIDTFLDASPEPSLAEAGLLKRLATIPYQDAAGVRATQNQTTFGVFVKSLFPSRGFAPQGMALAIAGILGIWLGVTADLVPDAQAIQLDAGSYLVDNPDLQKDLRKFQ